MLLRSRVSTRDKFMMGVCDRHTHQRPSPVKTGEYQGNYKSLWLVMPRHQMPSLEIPGASKLGLGIDFTQFLPHLLSPAQAGQRWQPRCPLTDLSFDLQPE